MLYPGVLTFIGGVMNRLMDKYMARVDRNIGVIGMENQMKLKETVVSIAGCGGMGGLIAATLARIGVGRIRIADNQLFDASNINRQFAATFNTIGRSKALETYKMIKEIVDDVEIDVFKDGITADNAEEFVRGADVVCDEIEFFEIGARIQLHRACRKCGVPVFNCNVIGFGTRIFFFTPYSMTVEEFLEMDESTTLTEEVVMRLIQRLAPRAPAVITNQVIEEWAIQQHKAPIFGGTPPLSTGVVVDRLCVHLLGMEEKYGITKLPPMPGYGYIDIGSFEAGIYVGKWW